MFNAKTNVWSIGTINGTLTQQGIHRFIATFGIRKMWDESWRVLEHPEFTNKPYYSMDTPEDTKLAESSPWSIRYTMSQKEMDEVNAKTTDLDVQLLSIQNLMEVD